MFMIPTITTATLPLTSEHLRGFAIQLGQLDLGARGRIGDWNLVGWRRFQTGSMGCRARGSGASHLKLQVELILQQLVHKPGFACPPGPVLVA